MYVCGTELCVYFIHKISYTKFSHAIRGKTPLNVVRLEIYYEVG